MTTLREAAQQALEALEALQGGCTDSNDGTVEAITVWCPEVIDTLRAALEQPEPEPVAWMVYTQDGKSVCVTDNPADFIEWRSFPLYTHPPRREWRGLTEEEIWACNRAQSDEEFYHICVDHQHVPDFSRAIEAALKERNA
jgi:hypothetical protein